MYITTDSIYVFKFCDIMCTIFENSEKMAVALCSVIFVLLYNFRMN